MIWFTCKCGKRLSRPDSQAGTMVFCDCGNGVRVPWSSTVAAAEVRDAEPVPIPIPAARPAPPPRPAPRRDERPPRRYDEPPRRPAPPPADHSPAPKKLERIPRRVRAHLCYNHDEDASTGTCAACRLPFCGNCLITLQGKTLCGPCKNFDIGGLGRPTRSLPLALLALIFALVSAPVMFVLSLLAYYMYLGEGMLGVAIALCLLGLALPVAAVWLAVKAMSRLESRPQYGGYGLAAGAACAGAVGLLWTVGVGVIVIARASGG